MPNDIHDPLDALLSSAVLSLRSHLPPNQDASVSVFIDPTLNHTICDDAIVQNALSNGVLQRVPLSIAHDDIDPEAMPYLLHAPSEHVAERAIECTLRIALMETLANRPTAATRQVCAWIVGEVTPRPLAIRLSDAALIRKPDGSRRPFRYWDPRVMWHLPRVMPPFEWASLRDAVGKWLTLDMTNQLTALPPVDTNHAHSVSGMHKMRMGAQPCTPLQWATLSRIGAINMAMAQAHEWGITPTHEVASHIDALLQTCHALGFDTERDEQVFVACGLTSHIQFYEHPEVNIALKRSATAGQDVMSALGRFDDQFWGQLQQSNWHPNQRDRRSLSA